MMQLCVGAVSRRAVEVAAKLQVHQIVASNAQVNPDGGYTGMTQQDLVSLVRQHSATTEIIRDHGGPRKGVTTYNSVQEMTYDLDAGFTGLHLDVCQIPRADQIHALQKLYATFVGKCTLEIGGEHEPYDWNHTLYDAIKSLNTSSPAYAVVSMNTRAWADKNYGNIFTPNHIEYSVRELHARGIRAKAHNMDWVPERQERYGDILDAYNLAPEIGVLETDLVLSMIDSSTAYELLSYAWNSKKWTRWFKENEGTWLQQAKCALRYLQRDPYVVDRTHLSDKQEGFVRRMIRDALMVG